MDFNTTLISTAKQYAKARLSVIPTKADKTPVGSWKLYQKHRPTDEEIETGFSNPKTQTLSIVTGAVSKNLEVIDVDTKHDLTGDLWERLDDYLFLLANDFHKKMVVARTISGGYHIFYRTRGVVEGNRKLVTRQTTAAEREIILYENMDKGKTKAVSLARKATKTLIETRGEGGYVVAAPSKGYEIIKGDLNDIPVIDEETRENIFTIISYLQPTEQADSLNFQIEGSKRKHAKSYRLPVPVARWALSNKLSRILPVFLVMKDMSSGHLRLTTEKIREICSIAEVSIPTFYKIRDILVELNWVGIGRHKQLMHIRGWDFIMKVSHLQGKSSVAVEQKHFKTIRAFCFAADLGHFIKTRKKLAEEKTRCSDQRAKDPAVLNGFSEETGEDSHYSKLGVILLAGRYETDPSTISKWKKEAKEAGYLDYDHNYAYLGVPERNRQEYMDKMQNVAHKVVGYMGLLYLQLTDSFLVNMKYFTVL